MVVRSSTDAVVKAENNLHVYSHPKTRRLLKRQEFKRLLHHRSRFQGQHFTIDYILRKDFTYPRLGVTITRQYGKAHDRNLFKRRIKEIFRIHAQGMEIGVDLNVRPKAQVDSFKELEQEFQRFLNQLSCPTKA